MIGSVTAIDLPGTGAKTAEVERDNHRDESPEHKNELALRHQIGFAGLIDQLGNVAHRAMNRQVLQLHIDRQAEQQAADAEQQSDRQKVMPVQAEEICKAHARQIRQDQVGFASARVLLRAGECGKQQDQKGCHGFVLTLEEGSSATHDGPGKLLHRPGYLVSADDLACE